MSFLPVTEAMLRLEFEGLVVTRLAWTSAVRRAEPVGRRADHVALIDVLCGDDPAAAGQAMREHVQRDRDQALHVLAPYFTR
ncbi:MAG: hypothetical protein EXQ48_06275 [Acidobacteria bacterium]|nr:hypothetical protein [Acidobacteriota bacterium]